MKINNIEPNLVVVTGAGSGIGRATAKRFARRGGHVVVSDINLDSASETVAMIRAAGNRASAAQLDVTDPAAWDKFSRDVHAEFGVPDVVVNNAGMLVSGGIFDLEPEDWDLQLGVNLLGVVYGCRAFGKLMVDNGKRGHIVNIASAASLTPISNFPAYSVSKAGVKMLSECLRLELGAHGIGVSAICPGVINTNIGNNAKVVGVDPELVARGLEIQEAIRGYVEKLPFSPMSPDLVARAVARSVRLDLAVVPVRSEAWMGYFLGRIAPGINRNVGRLMSTERAEEMGARALARFEPLISRFVPSTAPRALAEDAVDGEKLVGVGR